MHVLLNSLCVDSFNSPLEGVDEGGLAHVGVAHTAS
jgi:hypothetical protein